MIVLREKKFGLLSKILGIISPSAWLGKETAKFASNSKREYKKKRWKYMLKGLLGGTANANYQFQKARNGYISGKSADEIESDVNDIVTSYGTGIGEHILTNMIPGGKAVEKLAEIGNAATGLHAWVTGKRKKFNEEEE